MIGPRKTKPADGNLRASENVGSGQGSNTAKVTPENTEALCLALAATEAALERLEAYALATDTPPVGVVEAADNLAAARVGLAAAVTGGRDHAPD